MFLYLKRVFDLGCRLLMLKVYFGVFISCFVWMFFLLFEKNMLMNNNYVNIVLIFY